MKRIIFTFAALFLLSGLLVGCGSTTEEKGPGQQDQLKVYTSIYPLYDFAKRIGGDKIIVTNIIPPGAEPHDWEPTPQDVAQMSNADVLILSGTGVEPWADKVLSVIDQTKVTVVYGGQNIELIEGVKHEHNEHQDGKEEHDHEQDAHKEGSHQEEPGKQEEHGHDHGGKDPHVWLDPLNAKVMVDNILTGLSKADEKNKSFYEANAESYKKELDKLHEEYQSGLAQTKIKEFVTSHAAFGYLAKRYGLTEIPVRGLSAESEPSPADMAAVVKLAREKNIKHIFFETLVSPKVSEAIASELKAETLVLNPLEGLSDQEMAGGQDYLSVMRQNLQNLKIALGAN
ncbi:MAG: metal ABC transporter substrate-binding protein [Bacillota bacterium]